MQVVRQCPRCGVPKLGIVCTTCGFDPAVVEALEKQAIGAHRRLVGGLAGIVGGWMVGTALIFTSSLAVPVVFVGTIVGLVFALDGAIGGRRIRRRLAEAKGRPALPAARVVE